MVAPQGLSEALPGDLPFPSVPLHLALPRDQQNRPSEGSPVELHGVMLQAHRRRGTQGTQPRWPRHAHGVLNKCGHLHVPLPEQQVLHGVWNPGRT